MEFFIVLFGLIFVANCLMNEQIDKDMSKRRQDRIKAEWESYKPVGDEYFIVRDMVAHHREECIEQCKKYILPFSPDLTISNNKLEKLMFAMNGHLDSPVLVGAQLIGPSWEIQKQIEFWHQLENALHDAGRTDAKFYVRPGTAYLNKVTFDENGKPQFPYSGATIVFGEEAKFLPQYNKRAW